MADLRTIKAKLEPKYQYERQPRRNYCEPSRPPIRHQNPCIVRLHYVDPKFEVYSYELGDGIWGSDIDTCEMDEPELKKLFAKYGADNIIKVLDEGTEVEIDVPISEINPEYSIVDKKTGRNLMISDKDMAHMCTEGVITLPDGDVVELDSERSPLRQMGMI